MPSDRPGIAPPLPASGRPTQPRLALARCRRRTRHPAKPVRAMVRGFARKPSRGRYRRGVAGDRRSRPRRTDRHPAATRLRARLRRRCSRLTGRRHLCTDHIRPAGAPPPRPTSIGAAGRLQSEWVADFNRNARPTSSEYAAIPKGLLHLGDTGGFLSFYLRPDFAILLARDRLTAIWNIASRRHGSQRQPSMVSRLRKSRIHASNTHTCGKQEELCDGCEFFRVLTS